MFQGKKVLVTGASSGIGKAIALKFLEEGAAVAICGAEEAALNEAVQQMREAAQRTGEATHRMDGAAHRMDEATHRTGEAAHRTDGATHRTGEAAHRTDGATHRMDEATHRMDEATHRTGEVTQRTSSPVQQMSGAGEVYGYVTDVSDATQAAALVDRAHRQLGQIDVLINNAGIAPMHDFLTLPLSLWERTVDVNLKGVFLVGQAVSRIMAAQGGGTIVNMSSTNGLFGEAGLAAYNASKAGVILLTKTMALELARYGIRVNAVCPGFIDTGLAANSGFDEAYLNACIANVPLARWGTPEEVADLFMFLASPKSSYITGQCFIIDGGQTASQ